MSDLQERLAEVREGHRLSSERFHKLTALEGEPDADNLSPGWQQWYDDFNEIKYQMYALAHELDVPFERGGTATAQDYAQVWDQVQERLTEEGNRRQGSVKKL